MAIHNGRDTALMSGDQPCVRVGQVTSPNSTDVSGYGVYDASTIQKDVTAVVNVTFSRS